MRAVWILGLTISCFMRLTSDVFADPGEHWKPMEGESWIAAAMELRSYHERHKPTAVMIVQDGLLVANKGEVSRKVNVRSVRKSLLGALYGIAIAEERISLVNTLAQLGLDDKPPSLSHAEKQATVRDLLMSRSGVYHPASYESADMQEKRPARGSQPAGTFWYYNNWDFNALGTIYRRATGEEIFESFLRRIARPIGMEDFRASDGSYVLDRASDHPAYPFRMTARDLARFGQLILNGGRWNGAQIVPADWIRESTTAYSKTDRSDRSYGYLWWVLAPERLGPGAVIASGVGGQIIAIVPAKRLVAVEIVDLAPGKAGIRTTDFLDLVQRICAVVH